MIKLIEIKRDDLEFVRKLRNKNREYFFNQERITARDQLKWFRNLKNIEGYTFFVIWVDHDPIGTISLTYKRYGCEIGNIIIDEKYRHQGYLRETMEHIFNTTLMSGYFLKVKPTNIKAIKAYEALGFREGERILWKKQ